jgi:hypothetical protein
MTEAHEPDGGNLVPVIAGRALAAPAAVDRTARTVGVVRSTGARARNFMPPLEPMLEELAMAPGAVGMDRLHCGRAPVPDRHRRGGARDVLSRVLGARLEVGRGYATLQFSAAVDAQPAWQRTADGTLQSISYRVHRYGQFTGPSTGQTVHRAVDCQSLTDFDWDREVST